VSEVVEPSPRADAPIAFDSADGYLLLFGGFFVVQYGQPYVRLLNSTWAYSQAPNVFAEVSPPNPESGQSVLFVGLSVGSPSPTSVGWSLGDGTTSPNSTTRHEYAQPDVYRATFRANLTANTSFVESSVVVTVHWPGVTIVATPSPGDVGVPVGFSASISVGTGPYGYFWSTNGTDATDSTSNLSAPQFTYLTAGIFPVRVVLTDTLGTRYWGFTNVTVHPDPTATGIELSEPRTDAGVSEEFDMVAGNGTPPYVYSWQFGPAGASFITDYPRATYPYQTSGTYRVTAWANDSLGQSIEASADVVVAARPEVAINVALQSVDVGTPLTFGESATGGTGPFLAQWEFGDGTGSSGSDATHTYATTGNFSVLLEWTDSIDVSAWANTTVRVVPRVTAVVQLSNTTPDLGVPVRLSANVSGGVAPFAYAWSGLPPGCGPSDLESMVCAPLRPGTYPIGISIADAAFAAGNATAGLDVEFNFSVSLPPRVVVGQSFVLGIRPMGGFGPLQFAYLDLPPGCSPSDEANLTCVPTTAGNFLPEVSVTDANGNSVQHSVPLEVQPSEGHQTSVAAGLPSWTGWAVLGAVGALAAIVLAYWSVRRTRTPPGQPR
jgi:hypothetical protein